MPIRREQCRVLLILLLQSSAGCTLGPGGPLQLRESVQRPPASAVIFLADGLARDRMHELLAAGELPNIRRHFLDGGVEVGYAIASLPPTTYVNTVSLLTGVLAGRHGILGNEWFDRRTMEFTDYAFAQTFQTVNDHFSQPTLYELLADHYTVNVQCHTRRGVKATIDNPMETLVDWWWGKYENVDRRVGWELSRVAAFAHQRGQWPTVAMFYFPGLDEVGHRAGPQSARYTAAARNVDAQVGRVIAQMHQAGLAESTYFVLLSDHGMVQTPASHTFNVAKWLRQRCGLRVRQRRLDAPRYTRRLDRMEDFDAVLISDTNRRAAIHLRGTDWADGVRDEHIQRVLQPPAAEGEGAPLALDTTQHAPRVGRAAAGRAAPDASRQGLAAQPAVGLICLRDGPDAVRIVSRAAAARIERRERAGVAEYRLVPIDGTGDPLGYRERADLAPFVDAGWHSSRAWLAATARTRWPDLVPQAAEMFRSPRAGDIVLLAADDWSFERREPGGHGSGLDTDMRAVLFFAGPDLPRGGRMDHARLVDVMPTLLELLGEARRLDGLEIDGVSRADELRSTEPRP